VKHGVSDSCCMMVCRAQIELLSLVLVLTASSKSFLPEMHESDEFYDVYSDHVLSVLTPCWLLKGVFRLGPEPCNSNSIARSPCSMARVVRLMTADRVVVWGE